MSSSPEPVGVHFSKDAMRVELDDGRALEVPIAWFPRLLQASDRQRAAFELSPMGLHWDEIDEDISVAGLLAGRGDMTRRPPQAA